MFPFFKNIRISIIWQGRLLMKVIEIDEWDRKEHYRFFKNFDYPHFNVCANVELDHFMQYIRSKGYPFFGTFMYYVMCQTNQIREFRYRIRGEEVVEHDQLHPSFTVMGNNGLFVYCTVDFKESLTEFIANLQYHMDRAKQESSLNSDAERDDLIYITSLPWVSFTSITHPIHMHPVDSIPRISWGKYFVENGRLKLPISVQVHHGLADGVHVGRFLEELQKTLIHPEKV